MNAGVTALDQRADILTGIAANPSGRHSGCRPRFGPDGFLWVGTGDAATGTNPQDPNSLNGKTLRITVDVAPAAGNAGPPFRPEIYTYGHRNVQGIAFAADGTAYSVEHGTDRDDEVNILVRGGNYGWDPVPGYDETQPMTDLTKFPNARVAVWSSGFPTIAHTVEGLWDRIHDQGRLRVAVEGPDGALYLTTDSATGSILRVTGTPP